MPKISFDKLMASLFIAVGLILLIFSYHMFLITSIFNLILAIPCISGLVMILIGIKVFKMKDE